MLAKWNCSTFEAVELEFVELEFVELEFAELEFAELEFAELEFAELEFAELEVVELEVVELEVVELEVVELEGESDSKPKYQPEPLPVGEDTHCQTDVEFVSLGEPESIGLELRLVATGGLSWRLPAFVLD